MLIREVLQKSALFVTSGLFWIKGLSFNQISTILLFQTFVVLIIFASLTELAKVMPWVYLLV